MADDSDDSDDSGKSFEELKDEYDSGEADWADESDGATNGDADDAFAETADDGNEFDGLGDDLDEDFATDDGTDDDFDEDFAAEDGLGDDFDEDFAAEDGLGDDFDEDFATDDGTDGDLGEREFGQSDDGSEAPSNPERTPDATPADVATDGAAATAEGTGAGDLQFAANTMMQGSGTSKPYLETVPSGYVGDLLVMEWLEYLVEQGDVEDAARAVEYYRRIRWLGEDAADQLRDFLIGFGELDADREVTGAPSTLSIDHHVASLRYISRLTGSTADSVVFDCWSGGGGVPFGL
jgi:flagellar protein FlaE/flagellar protein FlaC